MVRRAWFALACASAFAVAAACSSFDGTTPPGDDAGNDAAGGIDGGPGAETGPVLEKDGGEDAGIDAGGVLAPITDLFSMVAVGPSVFVTTKNQCSLARIQQFGTDITSLKPPTGTDCRIHAAFQNGSDIELVVSRSSGGVLLEHHTLSPSGMLTTSGSVPLPLPPSGFAMLTPPNHSVVGQAKLVQVVDFTGNVVRGSLPQFAGNVLDLAPTGPASFVGVAAGSPAFTGAELPDASLSKNGDIITAQPCQVVATHASKTCAVCNSKVIDLSAMASLDDNASAITCTVDTDDTIVWLTTANEVRSRKTGATQNDSHGTAPPVLAGLTHPLVIGPGYAAVGTKLGIYFLPR